MKMKLNDMLYDLLDLAKQENEPNRYAHSEEYNKLFDELDNKTLIIDILEKELGCPLEVMFAVFKAIQQGFIFVDLGNELYRENNIKFDYADISEDEEGYIGCNKSTNYHYILDYDGCVFVEDYKKTWFLKKDKSA